MHSHVKGGVQGARERHFHGVQGAREQHCGHTGLRLLIGHGPATGLLPGARGVYTHYVTVRVFSLSTLI